MAAIIYASILAALLIAPALHLIGMRWIWAVVLAAILATAIGHSASEAVGLL